MAQVVLKNIWKRYPNGFAAVKNFNLEIHDQEFIVLVGPSGCGKSTTLRMVAGLEDVSEGEIRIGDRTVNEVPPKDRDIAMVFQNYALYPHWSVFDNMAFGLRLRKLPKEEVRNRVEEAAKILEIDHLLDRKPRALSGGQRQRVAMGRAIVRNPKVFLFDEPLSNLDAKLRVQMRVEISRLHNRLKTTIIYVTHDQIEAMTLADRIVIMNQGEVQQMGSPLDVYERPANLFVATFIGSPSMNILDARFDGNGIAGDSFLLKPTARQAQRLGRANGPISVGVRPQHLRAVRDATGAAFTTRVDVVEHLGSEKYAYFSLGGKTLTARLAEDDPVTEGAPAAFSVDMTQVLLFGPDGANLMLDGKPEESR